MKKMIIQCLIFLFAVSSSLLASPTKRTIRINIPATIDKINFTYRDSAFNDKFITITNPTKKDTVVCIERDLYSGQVLSRKEVVNVEGIYKLISQSFIVPDKDTIQFELDINRKLNLKEGVKFFIEDIIDVYVDFPGTDETFLDRNNGPLLIKTIFEKNNISIEKKYNLGLLTHEERTILMGMVKTDYYCRKISWALKNHTINEIKQDIANLNKDKNELQNIISASITQLFGKVVQYVITRNKLDQKDTRKMINSIIEIGWDKNISFGYIRYILADIKKDHKVLALCYNDLKEYLSGEFPEELEKLRKKMLPIISNSDYVVLMDVDGNTTTLKQLLEKNPKNYILIDFWASWCVPCRQESPSFAKAKIDFANKNITFLSISIDDDTKVENWKKALKEDGFFKSTNHYKLIKPKDNPLFKSFTVPSIPRYILINSKAEFIDPDFYRPSDPEFKKVLSDMLLSLDIK